MPFPASWPPSTGSGRKSVRIYVDGTATGDWADNAFMFADLLAARCGQTDAFPLTALRIYNDGTADLYITFDGVNIHGILRPGEGPLYLNRVESGIAVRTNPTHPSPLFTAFRIEGW